MKLYKKILLVACILIVAAGVLITTLKGYNVSLLYAKHENVDVYVSRAVDLKELKEICNEVFANKNYVVRNVELFGESFQISIDSITDEEKANLVAKVNEKYSTEITVDDLTVYTVYNVRIRDIVSPYILPAFLVAVSMVIYMGIRFMKKNPLKKILNLIALVVGTELVLASLIVILRLPVMPVYINVLMVVAVIEAVVYLYKIENAEEI